MIYNLFRVLPVLIAILVLSGCSTAKPMKTTASGRPEATFQNTNADDVASKIANACMSNGILVLESNSHQVICGKQLEGGDAILATMLIGNSYSTTPEQKIRFNIVQFSGNVKVQAYQWIETQMAFGQMRRQELNSGDHFNKVQQLLNSLGGS